MKKIGVLFGMENTFPGALVERINSMNAKTKDGEGISAEFVQVGGVRLDKPPAYAVIVDRISHDIPFYRAFLKHAALFGYGDHQQSVLVVGGRQVFQLLAGGEAGSGGAADGDSAAQEVSRRHDRPVDA